MAKMKKPELELKMIKEGLTYPPSLTKTTRVVAEKVLGNKTLTENKALQTFGNKFLYNIESVCLMDHLKVYEKNLPNNPINSVDYIAELKVNDFRCVLTYSPEVGFEAFSRNISIKNFLNGCFTDKLLFIHNGIVQSLESFANKLKTRFVLDCGIIVASKNYVFDGVAYTTLEDLLQSILGSDPDRAKQWQLEGNTLKFKVLDALYWEKDPVDISNLPLGIDNLDFLDTMKLSSEEAKQIQLKYEPFLKSVGLYHSKPKQMTVWEKDPGKNIYSYLHKVTNLDLVGDIRHRPFKYRNKLKQKIVESLKTLNLPIEDILTCTEEDKTQFIANLINSGKEGAILKNIHAPYFSLENRSHRSMFKVKTSLSKTLNSVEDFDCFILGCEQPKSKALSNRNIFASLIVGVYLQERDGTLGVHEIARISGISYGDKLKISYYDDIFKQIKIKEEFLGKVIAIDGMCISNKELKFTHAVLKDDDFGNKSLAFKAKLPRDCVQSREQLEQLILVRGDE